MTDDNWRDYAACANTDPEAFFPDGHEHGIERAARKICNERCEVRAQCLNWALENDERLGIWGGLSANGRRRLRLAGHGTAA